MKKSSFVSPDEFASSPLLGILPTYGDVGKLSALMSSLYARFEKVNNLLERENVDSVDLRRRLLVEQAMLKQVLDWVSAGNEQ